VDLFTTFSALSDWSQLHSGVNVMFIINLARVAKKNRRRAAAQVNISPLKMGHDATNANAIHHQLKWRTGKSTQSC
jgi:hypothetical protein